MSILTLRLNYCGHWHFSVFRSHASGMRHRETSNRAVSIGVGLYAPESGATPIKVNAPVLRIYLTKMNALYWCTLEQETVFVQLPCSQSFEIVNTAGPRVGDDVKKAIVAEFKNRFEGVDPCYLQLFRLDNGIRTLLDSTQTLNEAGIREGPGWRWSVWWLM